MIIIHAGFINLIHVSKRLSRATKDSAIKQTGASRFYGISYNGSCFTNSSMVLSFANKIKLSTFPNGTVFAVAMFMILCGMWCNYMMTSSNGNIFGVTGHLCGEFTGPPVNSPHKGQWRGALMFSLICVWVNGRETNREAGDLRRYRAHYEVIVMVSTTSGWCITGIDDIIFHIKLSMITR